MPRYRVTFCPDTIVRRIGVLEITVAKTKVGVKHAVMEIIEADYVKMEGGHIVFRNYGPRGGYPELVKIIAPGIWSEVDRELS